MLGCHLRWVPDSVVFELVVVALVHGSGFKQVASHGCSNRTIRHPVHEWAIVGVNEDLNTLVLRQYGPMIRTDLTDVLVEGSITKASGGGEKAGRSPLD